LPDQPWGIAVGDLNGDGKVDIEVTNAASNTVSLLLASGSGAFASVVTYTVGAFP
jgi:hypothetical protein